MRLWLLVSVSLVCILPGLAWADTFSIVLPSGGDCTRIGEWDVTSATCTLMSDRPTDQIRFASSTVTFDGAGFSIGSVDIENEENITVENLSTVGRVGDYSFSAAGDIHGLTLENDHFSQSNPGGLNFLLNYPLDIYGNALDLHIDQSNTVDGKTLYYFENQSGTTFSNLTNAGIFYCVHCDHITLASTTFDTLQNVSQINLYNVSSSSISGNTVSGSENNYGAGVYGVLGADNTFLHNTIENNLTGAFVIQSPRSIWKENIFTGNSGLSGGALEFNTGDEGALVQGNTFMGNGYAVLPPSSGTTTIVQNNFIHDSQPEVWNENPDTIISEPLPIGGNFWSANVSCSDTDANGVCDVPYSYTAPFNSRVTFTDALSWSQENGWQSFASTTSTGDDNVLFLPGLEASRLYESEGSGETKLWEPGLFSDISPLYLNSNGQSINQIYTRDILNSYPGTNIYASLIDQMNNLVSSGKITAWQAYAYDWRQGIDDLINNGTPYQIGNVSLITTLQTLVNTSKTGKVTIVAHSNGGLLAKALIKKLEDMKASGQNDLIDHIDNLIMVAAPQIGTPDAVSSILDGYGQGVNFYGVIPVVKVNQARDLSVNMPSAYGLLPSTAYFKLSGIDPVASFSSTFPTLFKNFYGSNITTYSTEHNFIIGAEGRNQPADSDVNSPMIGNSLLLSQAENLHDKIDNLVIPYSIKVYDIAGWGKDTIAGMTYGNDSLDPIISDNGDGVVMSPSALYGQGTKYWLDLSQSKLDHKQIMEDPQMLAFVDSVLENSTSSPLSTDMPRQIGNRLHLSVHSPVSIGAYDNAGNFTGKICDDSSNCTVEENIPGSTYMEFGEGKYVGLPENNLETITLQGLDTGAFTFDDQVVQPNGQSTTTAFMDLPVTAETTATITQTATGTPIMFLDIDGDGTPDATITPETDFDPVEFLQILQKTVDSFGLTKAQQKNLDTRIQSIINSIQKGKIKKANLKAENFALALQRKIAKPLPKNPKKRKLTTDEAQELLTMVNALLDNLSN